MQTRTSSRTKLTTTGCRVLRTHSRSLTYAVPLDLASSRDGGGYGGDLFDHPYDRIVESASADTRPFPSRNISFPFALFAAHLILHTCARLA
jgi:hypothetical protein